ncbi:PEP-CTERM sorting domain-containing protein [Pseudomonadota bacterium]
MKQIAALMFLSSITFQANAMIITTYTDEAEFNAAAGAITVEDFTGETAGAFDSRDFGDFTIDLMYDEFGRQPEITTDGELRLQTRGAHSASTMNFDTGITALGFDWRNTDDRDQMGLYFNEYREVPEISFGAAGGSGFFGVIADTAFTLASLSDVSNIIDGGSALYYGYIDNIRYSSISGPSVPVSLPTTLALMGLGLIGVGYSRKKMAA